MRVVRLTPKHATAYRALMLEAYELHPDAFTSTVAERAELPLSWSAARMTDAPNANEAVFGAFFDGTLAGVVGLRFETRQKAAHKATLFGLYVPQRFRRLGLGRGLVDAILNHAKTRSNVLLVQLTVTADIVPARRLYESCGFVPFGDEPLAACVGSTYVSKLRVWCSLRPPGENPANLTAHVLRRCPHLVILANHPGLELDSSARIRSLIPGKADVRLWPPYSGKLS